MRIPSHQIYNILNSYSKWVSKNGNSSSGKISEETSEFDQPGILAKRYRESIVEKVTGNIISKITRIESNNQKKQGIAEELKCYGRQNGKLDEKNEDTFVFNFIDEHNKKTKKTLLIDTSSLLAKNADQKSNKKKKE